MASAFFPAKVSLTLIGQEVLPVSLSLASRKCEPLFLASTASSVLMWVTALCLISGKKIVGFLIRESQNGPEANPYLKADTMTFRS